MTTSFRKQPWRIRKSRRVHAFPVIVNGYGKEVCAVYLGDECAEEIRRLPQLQSSHRRLIRIVGRFFSSLSESERAVYNRAIALARAS
jgi:hypothetical protein